MRFNLWLNGEREIKNGSTGDLLHWLDDLKFDMDVVVDIFIEEVKK